MIELKDLVLRRYNQERKCVGFTYDLNLESGLIQSFIFNQLSSKVWKVETVFFDLDYKKLTFELPRENMDLIIIAAIGLNYFKMAIVNEIQEKQDIEFTIGEVTNGVIG